MLSYLLERELYERAQRAMRLVVLAPMLINSRAGLGRAIYKLRPYPDEPPLHYFGVDISHPERYISGQNMGAIGGCGYVHEEGLAAALGELVERYALFFNHELPLWVGTYSALPSNEAGPHPNEYALYAPEQYADPRFPYKPFTEDLEIAWIKAEWLNKGKPAWVPASMALAGRPEILKYAEINQTISSGTAVGFSITDATISAILERIERDAFACYWYNALPPVPLDPLSDPVLAAFYKHYFAGRGVHYRLYDITTDLGVPAVFVVATSNDDTAAIHVGTAAGLTLRQAALKALREAGQGRPYTKYLGRRRFDSPDEVLTFADHVRFWNDQARIAELRFLDAEHPRPQVKHVSWSVTDPDQLLEKLISHLSEHSIDILRIDITPSDIRELGLYVVRVVIPQLQDIDGTHRFRPLGGKRLYEVPCRLGYASKPRSFKDFNPLPHPSP
jgi:ribosomal protein S12 methylthiotransferase accessory factor